jgi:hypothetical protein
MRLSFMLFLKTDGPAPTGKKRAVGRREGGNPAHRRLVAQRGQVSMLVEGTLWPQVGQLNQ